MHQRPVLPIQLHTETTKYNKSLHCGDPRLLDAWIKRTRRRSELCVCVRVQPDIQHASLRLEGLLRRLAKISETRACSRRNSSELWVILKEPHQACSVPSQLIARQVNTYYYYYWSYSNSSTNAHCRVQHTAAGTRTGVSKLWSIAGRSDRWWV